VREWLRACLFFASMLIGVAPMIGLIALAVVFFTDRHYVAGVSCLFGIPIAMGTMVTLMDRCGPR
jgi:hypothetical protein